MFFCILYMSLCLIKSSFAEEIVLNNELGNNKNSRSAKSFLYINNDSFFKNYPAPTYRPMHHSLINGPIYNENIPQVYRIYQLSEYQPVPYMIPVSDEIVSQVTDPIYQNKGLGVKPSSELAPLCKGKRVQIPSPVSCSAFINCWDGIAFEQECPGGLMFSNEGFCDYTHRVNCDRRPVKVKMPVCGEEFSAFRNSEACGEFFICVNRQPVKFKCPADLHYNERLGVCDYPYRVNCNDTSTPTPASSSSSSGEPTTSASSSATTPHVEGTAEYKMVTPYIAMSKQDALRHIEEDRLSGNRLGVDDLQFGHHYQV